MTKKSGKVQTRQSKQKKANRELKAMMRDFAIDEFDGFAEAFRTLDKNRKCDTYVKVLKYVLPTYSAIRFEDAGNATSASQLLRRAAAYKKGNNQTDNEE